MKASSGVAVNIIYIFLLEAHEKLTELARFWTRRRITWSNQNKDKQLAGNFLYLQNNKQKKRKRPLIQEQGIANKRNKSKIIFGGGQIKRSSILQCVAPQTTAENHV